MFEVCIIPKYSYQPLPDGFPVKDRGLFFTYKKPATPEKTVEFINEEDAEFLASLKLPLSIFPKSEPDTTKMKVLETDSANKAASCSREEIDETIKSIWCFGLKKGLCQETGLLDFHKATYGLSYIQSVISTVKNGVYWSYGSVAIIIGNAERKLFSKYPLGLSRHMPFNQPISDRCEFYLKAPFQVDEGF